MTLTCRRCGTTYTRPNSRGRKPSYCSDCRLDVDRSHRRPSNSQRAAWRALCALDTHQRAALIAAISGAEVTSRARRCLAELIEAAGDWADEHPNHRPRGDQ